MRRVLALASIFGALVALPACGGKTDERVRAAGITPTNALAFVTVSLDPSIEQKKNLLSIARAFPAAKAKDEFETSRDELLQRMLKGSGLDYATDVKPWLGNELAVAALPAPTAGGTPVGAIFLESRDDAKAEAAIRKADEEAGGGKSQHRMIGDFAVVVTDAGAPGTAALDAIELQSGGDGGGLAESPAFTAPVGELHGDRLVLGWVDSKRVLEAAKGAGEERGVSPLPLDFATQFENASPIAIDFHAGDKAFVVEGATKSTLKGKGGAPRLTESLPTATIAALTAFDIAGSFQQVLSQFGAESGEPGDAFRDLTGLDLQADLLSWMKGELVVAVGPAPAGERIPDFALVIEPSDRAAAEAAIPRIRAALARESDGAQFEQRTIEGVVADVATQPIEGTVQPAMALFPDRFVIASRPAYLSEVAKKSSAALGDSGPYKSVVSTGSSGATAFQLLVRLDPLRELLESSFGMADDAEYQADVRPNLVPLDTLGARAFKLGEYDRFELKLTVS